MGGRELDSRYLQSLATATPVADLCIVLGIGLSGPQGVFMHRGAS